MTALNIKGEGVRDETQRRVQLPRNAFRRRRHVWINQSRQEVDQVHRHIDHRIALAPLLREQRVAHVRVLKIQVAACRDGHRHGQALAQFSVFKVINVLLQQLIDIVREVRLALAGQVRLRHDTIVLGHSKLDDTVDKVAQVVEKLAVVLGNELVPGEHRVARLGTRREEVVAPDRGRNTGLFGICAKHTDVARLGELAAFIVEVLGSANVMHHGPCLLGSNLRAWENHGVEGNIVFAHKLIELHVVWVLPPLFPIGGVSRSDAGVADGRVKPDVEHLALETREGHGRTPLEIASNAARAQAFLQPRLCNVNTVARPLA